MLISSQVISDRLACQYHEHISGIFYVNDVQHRADYFYWGWSLGFDVKTRQIPDLYLFWAACHQVSALVFDDLLDLTRVNWSLSDQDSCGKFPNVKITVLASRKKNIFVVRYCQEGDHIDSTDLVQWLLAVSAPNSDESFVIKWGKELICVGIICEGFGHGRFRVVLGNNCSSFGVEEEDFLWILSR